ncbi:MAG: serine/threonine protein kinase [Myxococcaceae bacterium]
MLLPPGTLVGKYRVQRQLAQGGMAEVYLATRQGAEGFEKPVVIKRIRSELAHDTSFVEMFIAEAHLASRLSHPNLVHIFDFDRHEDTYYLAMEYIRGRALVEARKRANELGRPVPAVLAAHVGVEVARGLGYAHKLTEHGKPLNLVHRDVTPHNVLLSYDGAVKLTDFGIAKAAGRATTIGTLKGKFAYMAPEQARGESVDARTDLFALGITLWELLTGARLFHGDSDVAVLNAVQERPVVPPLELNPAVDEELSTVVLKALERTPDKRYQTAAELERALLQYVLHHSQVPEDTDVGAFIRGLFPLEAEIAESTVTKLQGGGWNSRDESAATVVPAHKGAGRARVGRRPNASGRLARDLPGDRTELFDSAAASATEMQPADRTPTEGGGGRGDEVPTLRARAPVRLNQLGRALAERTKRLLSGLETKAHRVAARLTGRAPSRAVLLAVAATPLALLVLFILVFSRPAVKATAVASAAAPSAPVEAALPPPPPSVAAPAEAPAAADEGFLELTLTPGGNVTIDGKEQPKVEGTQRFTLKAGHHEVMASDTKVITEWSVYVRPGATVKKHFSFPKHK